MRFSLLTLAACAASLSPVLLAQYTSTIVAGGGPPDGATATAVAVTNVGGVAVDAAGNLYFSSPFMHRVFKVAPNGVISTVAGKVTPGYSGDNGPATAAELNSPGSIAVDNAGNLYIADRGNNRVRKVSGGVISTVAGNGFGGSTVDGGLAALASINGHTIGGLAVDNNGNLYLAEYTRVRKVAGGIISTVAGTGQWGYSGDGGSATAADLGSISAIATDAAGNLFIDDSNNYRVRKVAGGIITTVAGTGIQGNSGDGGAAVSAQIGYVRGLAVDGAGSLYIGGDQGIRKVTAGIISAVISTNVSGLAANPAGDLFIADNQAYLIRRYSAGALSTVAGNGTYSYSGDGGPATSAQVRVESMARDSAGNLYIANRFESRVRRVAGGVITTVAGTGVYGDSGDGGLATSAQIRSVSGLATDGSGALYIADRGASKVRKVAGGVIATVAGNGMTQYSGDGGPALNAQFGSLGAMTADSAGTVYVADRNRIRKISAGLVSLFAGGGPADGTAATNVAIGANRVAVDGAGNAYIPVPNEHRVYRISADGVLTTFAGTGVPGTTGDNGPPTSAQLLYPNSIAVDSTGAVYIGQNNGVRKVAAGLITTVAGGGAGCAQQVNAIGDGCPATSVSIYPHSLAVDSAGTLYIATECRIRRVSNGIISTVAGTGVDGYSGDGGPAAAAAISCSSDIGLAVDGAGVLYIADRNNHRVRRVSAGVISTVAGTGVSGYSGDGGPAAAAQLNYPSGIAVDISGRLYIADLNNHRVRSILNSSISTVAGRGGYGYSGDGGLATNADLNQPFAVAVDATGRLYIADRGYRIRRVSGGIISTFAGNGFASYSGDGGPALYAQLGQPASLAVDNAGTVYVSDQGAGRVRAISAGGIITTFAGGGSQDGGSPTSVSLSPGSVAVDPLRNVYIVDRSRNVLQKVTGGTIVPVTPVTTSGFGIFGFFEGLYGGLANDTAGNVYISEGAFVRMLSPTTQPCTYSVQSASSALLPASGGALNVRVTTLAGCTWQVIANDGWASPQGPVQHVDTGNVVLSIGQNQSDGPRTSTLIIAGQPLTVTQAGRVAVSSNWYVPVTPCRIADTRNANGDFGGPVIAGGTSRSFTVPASACGIPSTAVAYSINVTVVPNGVLGHLTVWPSGLPQPVASILNSFDGRVKANAAIVPAGASGAISVFVTHTTHVILDVNGYFVPASTPSALTFYPLPPCRIADTRNTPGPLGGPAIPAGQQRTIPVRTSACGVPATAQAYSLNFTAVPRGFLGHVTTWPTGVGIPVVSTLNAPTGQITANAAIVPAGNNGDINVYATNETDLLIDINGYFAPAAAGGLSLYSLTPCRALDTREPTGSPTFSGIRGVPVAGKCGVPADAQAYVFGATVVPPTPLGHLALWPPAQSLPSVSTLNALDGFVTSNMAIVPASSGAINAYATSQTHLLLDISGYFAP